MSNFMNGNFGRGITISLISGLLTINGFMLGALRMDIKGLDNKIFSHLTNDEIHIPRHYAVSKAEFDMHCQFSKQEKDSIVEMMKELREDIRQTLNLKRDK